VRASCSDACAGCTCAPTSCVSRPPGIPGAIVRKGNPSRAGGKAGQLSPYRRRCCDDGTSRGRTPTGHLAYGEYIALRSACCVLRLNGGSRRSARPQTISPTRSDRRSRKEREPRAVEVAELRRLIEQLRSELMFCRTGSKLASAKLARGVTAARSASCGPPPAFAVGASAARKKMPPATPSRRDRRQVPPPIARWFADPLELGG